MRKVEEDEKGDEYRLEMFEYFKVNCYDDNIKTF